MQLWLVFLCFQVIFSAFFPTEENKHIVHHTRNTVQTFALNMTSADLLEQVQNIRKYVSHTQNSEAKIQDVIESGAVPDLINILQDNAGSDNLRFESAWALTNLAAGNSFHTELLAHSGAIEAFVIIIVGYKSEASQLVEQAVWALGNIAGDCAALRDRVLSTGVLLHLLRLIQDSDGSLLDNATWFLSNLCRGKPHVDFQLMTPALPTMLELMQNENEEIYPDLAWALSYLSDDPSNTNYRIQTIIDYGFVPFLINWLNNPDFKVVHPALRTIGNLVSGSDSQTQSVIDENFLQHVKRLLSHRVHSIRKETCWTLSNIAAGISAHIDLLFELKLVEPVLALFHDEEFEVKKEALWVISNISATRNRLYIFSLVEFDAIEGVMSFLASLDIRIGALCFDIIENVLETTVLTLQALDRMHTSRALEIISEYISYHKSDEEILKRGFKIIKRLRIHQVPDRRSSDSAAYKTELR